MTNDREEPSSANDGGKFHTVQPLRDQESNWAVDLAKNLEEYLLKICSGETTSDVDGHLSVNFAEAALLLQGSVQVYSRKVEYLYSLVLHALEFVSQKSQHDQLESASVQPEESGSHAVPAEEDDPFWGLSDIPVDAKNSLDNATCRDSPLDQFVKPPANLVVLEGDCLDVGDGGELESYLLATNDLYRDFILLDSCDAVAVDDFLKDDDKAGKWWNGGTRRGSSVVPKSRKSIFSPTRRSGGGISQQKLSAVKNLNLNLNDKNINQSPPANNANFKDNHHDFETDNGYSEPGDFDGSDDDVDDDGDDPWRPLNPYEPGNLKVKPFKKVRAVKRETGNACKRMPIIAEFPPAKLHGTISSDLTRVWEARIRDSANESHAPPLYEKMRQSLLRGMQENCDGFHKSTDDKYGDDEYDTGDFDSGPPDFDMQDDTYMNEGPSQAEKNDDCGNVQFNNNEAHEHEDPNFHASLEDLCRSHLDSLLASIAESEKQTELAARVSTWKQRIEHNLEEQDSRPPFDIHEYGEKVLDKLSLESNTKNAMSFADVVQGQEKHDIARTFSALLQLVNNGNIDLERGRGNNNNNEPPCYTALNPFYVRLIRNAKRREEVQLRSSKKRLKTPNGKGNTKGKENRVDINSPPSGLSPSTSVSAKLNSKLSIKVGKGSGFRCSPKGKKRQRSGIVEPVE